MHIGLDAIRLLNIHLKWIIILVALFVPLRAWAAEPTTWCPEFVDTTRQLLVHRPRTNAQELQAIAWGLQRPPTVELRDHRRYDRLLRVQARRAGSKWFAVYTNEQLLLGAAEDCAQSDAQTTARKARK